MLVLQSHLDVFKAQAEAALEFGPQIINSHSLRDSHTFDEATQFFEDALAWQQSMGIEVVTPGRCLPVVSHYPQQVLHECHRKRFLHSPWYARDFLPRFPQLLMTADLSHWINVVRDTQLHTVESNVL